MREWEYRPPEPGVRHEFVGLGLAAAMSAVADRHIPCDEIGPDTSAKTGSDAASMAALHGLRICKLVGAK